MKKAVANTFIRYFNPREFDELITNFEGSLIVQTGSGIPSAEYVEKLRLMGNLSKMTRRIEKSRKPAPVASAIEFALEGLHLSRSPQQGPGGWQVRLPRISATTARAIIGS